MLSQRQVSKMQVVVTEYFNNRSNLISFTSPSQVRKVDSSQGTLAILHSHGLSVLDLVKDEEGSSKNGKMKRRMSKHKYKYSIIVY